jgi:hypothetical protein
MKKLIWDTFAYILMFAGAEMLSRSAVKASRRKWYDMATVPVSDVIEPSA